jgi:GT2 family glycosyltransferase
LINPDITFKPGFVAPLAAALDRDPDAGSAAPLLLRPDGRTIDSAGLVMKKNRKAYDRARDLPFADGAWPPCRIFGASGAAGLLRRSMLEDVKILGEYFDESFHSYKEDVDLAWRANLFGKSLFVPEATALHERGWKVAGRKSVPRAIRINSHRNRYLTIIKNDDLVNFLFHLPWVLTYEIGLIIYSAIFEPFLFLAFRDIKACS